MPSSMYAPYGLRISDEIGEQNTCSVYLKWDITPILKGRPDLHYKAYVSNDNVSYTFLQECMTNILTVPTRPRDYWIKISAVSMTINGEGPLSEPCKIPAGGMFGGMALIDVTDGYISYVPSELVGIGDGVTTLFKTRYPYSAQTLSVFINGLMAEKGNDPEMYMEVDPVDGSFQFSTPPFEGARILGQYFSKI